MSWLFLLAIFSIFFTCVIDKRLIVQLLLHSVAFPFLGSLTVLLIVIFSDMTSNVRKRKIFICAIVKCPLHILQITPHVHEQLMTSHEPASEMAAQRGPVQVFFTLLLFLKHISHNLKQVEQMHYSHSYKQSNDVNHYIIT